MSDEPIFEPGNVVRLKSGGPRMTVEANIDNLGEAVVSCSWFDGTKLTRGNFPPAALERVGPDQQFAIGSTLA